MYLFGLMYRVQWFIVYNGTAFLMLHLYLLSFGLDFVFLGGIKEIICSIRIDLSQFAAKICTALFYALALTILIFIQICVLYSCQYYYYPYQMAMIGFYELAFIVTIGLCSLVGVCCYYALRIVYQ